MRAKRDLGLNASLATFDSADRARLLRHEAEYCRKQAGLFCRKPERPFLLNIARAFDDLASLSLTSGVVAEREVGDVSPDALPAPDTKRWVIHRKAEVIAAVEGGVLTMDEACDRYALSVEEIMRRQSSLRNSGLPGLRVTHIQDYRPLSVRRRG